jgi:hypothetical protein
MPTTSDQLPMITRADWVPGPGQENWTYDDYLLPRLSRPWTDSEHLRQREYQHRPAPGRRSVGAIMCATGENGQDDWTRDGRATRKGRVDQLSGIYGRFETRTMNHAGDFFILRMPGQKEQYTLHVQVNWGTGGEQSSGWFSHGPLTRLT